VIQMGHGRSIRAHLIGVFVFVLGLTRMAGT
jgi:hypothetical protein